LGTITVTADTNSGYITGSDLVYATARTDASSAANNDLIRILQVLSFATSLNNISRGSLGFDLSDEGITVTAASLFMWDQSRSMDQDYDVYIVEGTQSDVTVAAVDAQYRAFTGYNGSGAHTPTNYVTPVAATSFLGNRYNEFVFNATGIAAVNVAMGTSWLPLRVLIDRDVDNSTPIDNKTRSAYFYGPNTAGKEPYLELTYEGSYPKSIGGSITPSGNINIGRFVSVNGNIIPTGTIASLSQFIQSINGSMTPFGTLNTGNPNWIQIPDSLNWQGVWDADTAYSIDDAILYLFGDRYHVFISKTHHNTGNNPVTSTANWRRWDAQPWQPSEGV